MTCEAWLPATLQIVNMNPNEELAPDLMSTVVDPKLRLIVGFVLAVVSSKNPRPVRQAPAESDVID